MMQTRSIQKDTKMFLSIPTEVMNSVLDFISVWHSFWLKVSFSVEIWSSVISIFQSKMTGLYQEVQTIWVRNPYIKTTRHIGFISFSIWSWICLAVSTHVIRNPEILSDTLHSSVWWCKALLWMLFICTLKMIIVASLL
jgi:hypothetical protein